MQKTSRVANPRLSLLTISGVAFACALGFVPRAAIAQAGGAAHVGGHGRPPTIVELATRRDRPRSKDAQIS